MDLNHNLFKEKYREDTLSLQCKEYEGKLNELTRLNNHTKMAIEDNLLNDFNMEIQNKKVAIKMNNNITILQNKEKGKYTVEKVSLEGGAEITNLDRIFTEQPEMTKLYTGFYINTN
jgi:hypothetical protein